MIKAVRVLNIASVFLFIAVLILIYGYLPFNVDLNIDGVENIHKHRFYYYAITAFLIVNILLRVILKLGFKSIGETILAWMMSLIFILNFYLTLLVGFIGVWNNSAHIGPSSYVYLNYLGPVFLIIWIGGLIFLVLKNN